MSPTTASAATTMNQRNNNNKDLDHDSIPFGFQYTRIVMWFTWLILSRLPIRIRTETRRYQSLTTFMRVFNVTLTLVTLLVVFMSAFVLSFGRMMDPTFGLVLLWCATIIWFFFYWYNPSLRALYEVLLIESFTGTATVIPNSTDDDHEKGNNRTQPTKYAPGPVAAEKVMTGGSWSGSGTGNENSKGTVSIARPLGEAENQMFDKEHCTISTLSTSKTVFNIRFFTGWIYSFALVTQLDSEDSESAQRLFVGVANTWISFPLVKPLSYKRK